MKLTRGMRVVIGRSYRVGTRRVLATAEVLVIRWDPRGFWIGWAVRNGAPDPEALRVFRSASIVSLPGSDQRILPGIFENGKEAA